MATHTIGTRGIGLLGLTLALTLGSCKGKGEGEGEGAGGSGGPGGNLDFEAAWLDVPWDDAMDARTVLGVMGLRYAKAVNSTTVDLVFGPSFSNYEVHTTGFEIMSPDDENYEVLDFVNPTEVFVTFDDDVVPGHGGTAGIQQSWNVRLTLPSPMQEGSTYRIRAIGGLPLPTDIDPEYHWQDPWWGYPLSAGANAAEVSLSHTDEGEVTTAVVESVLGLRGVEAVADGMLRVTLGAAVDETLLSDASQYTLQTSAGALVPVAAVRRSEREVAIPGTGWPFQTYFHKHHVYLDFGSSLPSGDATLSVGADLARGRTSLDVDLDDLHNPHIKVNQEGYLPEVPKKRAFYGAWVGSEGALDIQDGLPCEVRDATSDATVWSGNLSIRHVAGTAGEGVYGGDYSGEEVHVCDFGALQDPGTYRVHVPGAGYSHEFVIGDDALDRAHRVAMYGLLWQRAGATLEGTGSAYTKIAGHDIDPVRIPYMDDRPIIGGHYDAGDYNPRVHTEVAEYLMLVCDLMPDKCGDGDLAVPEGRNGIPDLLDEAAWSLRPLLELQDTDGGIGGDVGDWGWSAPMESMADANFIETPERDPYWQYVGEKNVNMTTRAAGLFAQAAVLWDEAGDSTQAGVYRDAALLAWSYAEANGPATSTTARAYAAVNLARATGDMTYLDTFTETGFSMGTGDDDVYGVTTAVSYLQLPDDAGDALVKQTFRTNIIAHAAAWAADAETYSYPVHHHPWAPTNWGAGAYPTNPMSTIAAYGLERTPESLQRLHTAIDNTLGANPLGLSWIVGIGDRTITGPAHISGWHTWQGIVPPGLQSEGPIHDLDMGGGGGYIDPPFSQRPVFYKYDDTRFIIPMHEGVCVNFAFTAAAFSAIRSSSE